jgi:hypothetical protein
MTSLGSTAAASETEGPPKPAELDALEAEIETIKADIQSLRVGAESMHQTDISHTSDHQSDLPFRVEGSKIPAPINKQSAAKTGGGGSKRGEVKTLCSKTSPNINNPHSTPTPHSTQPSPHFAQPTQAATRRVHQTLRKDASPVKASPEPSPARSTKAKAPDFATDKRAAQRNQQRTSLPQSWTMSSPPMPESNALKDHPGRTVETEHLVMSSSAMPQGTTGSGTSSTSAQPAEQAPNSTTPQMTASPTEMSSTELEHSPSNAMLRKKTSSYMLPTAAAQRRSRVAVDHTARVARNLRQNKDFHKQVQANAENDSFSSLGTYNRNIELQLSVNSGQRPSEDMRSSNSAMRLPMPLPHVANTMVTRQEPDHNLLGPIREKLIKESLLRSDPTQDLPAASAPSGSQNDILQPVLAHLGLPMHGRSAGENVDQTVMVAHAQPAQDLSNEPISRLVSGLRGQSSANIGRALVSQQPAVPATSSSVVLHEGSKPLAFTDPAVLYEGPKPCTGGMFAASDEPIYECQTPLCQWVGYKTRKVASNLALEEREVPQSGSLRATAMTFVPRDAPSPINTSSLQEFRFFCHETDPGFDYMLDYVHTQPSYLGYPSEFISGETPTISPMSDGSLPGYDVGYNQGLAIPDWQFSADYESAQAPPPAVDPAYHQFHGNFAGRGTNMIAPYLNHSETPTFTSMPNASTPAVASADSMDSGPQWIVQSHGPRPYTWTGGGGREISFRGVGPDAEYDPNRPVKYRDLRTNTTVVLSPRHHGASSAPPPTAPRSMREQDQQEGK